MFATDSLPQTCVIRPGIYLEDFCKYFNLTKRESKELIEFAEQLLKEKRIIYGSPRLFAAAIFRIWYSKKYNPITISSIAKTIVEGLPMVSDEERNLTMSRYSKAIQRASRYIAGKEPRNHY
jgi:hypothetical protein